MIISEIVSPFQLWQFPSPCSKSYTKGCYERWNVQILWWRKLVWAELGPSFLSQPLRHVFGGRGYSRNSFRKNWWKDSLCEIFFSTWDTTLNYWCFISMVVPETVQILLIVCYPDLKHKLKTQFMDSRWWEDCSPRMVCLFLCNWWTASQNCGRRKQ